MNARRYAKRWSIIFVIWGVINILYGVGYAIVFGVKYHIATSLTCAAVSFVFAYLILKATKEKDKNGNDKSD